MDQEIIEIKPICIDGKYTFTVDRYVLEQIRYALERLRKQRESARKCMSRKKNGDSPPDSPDSGEKQKTRIRSPTVILI